MQNHLKGLVLMLPLIVSSVASASVRNFEFDKGTVIIKIAELEQPYSLKVTPSSNCHARTSITESGDTVSVRHDDGSCPMGSIFELSLQKGLSSSIDLLGGVIKVEDSLSAMRNFSSITAAVSGGVIESDVDGIKIEGSYGTPTCSYRNPSIESNITLKIRVSGGVLRFLR